MTHDNTTNNPPDPIDEALAPYADAIAEAETWLDGVEVTTEAQMNAVDALLKDIRTAGVELGKAQKDATAPLHDIWKAEIARWKPTADDIERIKKGLGAITQTFKQKLLAEKEAAKQKAYAAAREAERAAEAAAKEAAAGDIEAQREADALAYAAMAAKKQASEANRDKVTGLKTVKRQSVEDYSKAIRWMIANDAEPLKAFIDDYARQHAHSVVIDGVKTWTEKVSR